MTLPRLGVRLHGGLMARACVELAVAAERHGFDAIWFAENPYNRGVLPAVAACAVATQRITIGIGVFNPFNRHPTLIAMEMGALDELAEGRAALGLGVGLIRALTKASLPLEKPIAAMRDAIHIIRGMLRGETVTYAGKVFSAEGIKLEFKPPRADYPIYMAAMGDQSLRLTGEVADGLMISNGCPPGYTSRAMDLMGQGAARAGRPPPAAIVQYAPCVAQPDRVAARRHAASIVGGMIRSFWAAGAVTPLTPASMIRDSGIRETDFGALVEKLEAGGSAADLVEDRFIDRYSVAGDSDDCIAAINRYAEVGVTEMTLTIAGPDPIAEMAYLGTALKGMRT